MELVEGLLVFILSPVILYFCNLTILLVLIIYNIMGIGSRIFTSNLLITLACNGSVLVIPFMYYICPQPTPACLEQKAKLLFKFFCVIQAVGDLLPLFYMILFGKKKYMVCQSLVTLMLEHVSYVCHAHMIILILICFESWPLFCTPSNYVRKKMNLLHPSCASVFFIYIFFLTIFGINPNMLLHAFLRLCFLLQFCTAD